MLPPTNQIFQSEIEVLYYENMELYVLKVK